MKIKKLSLLLVLTMLLSLFAGIVPAQAAAGTDGAERFEILKSLGFFEKNVEYAEKASVTRGEIITAIYNALPEDRKVTAGDSTGFTDVSANDAIANVAATASNMKLLGNETEMKANNVATLEEASFIILNLLGYNTVAKGAYANFAASIGLTKNVSSSDKMSTQSLVAMLYNALDTDLLQKVFTNGETTMKTIKGETLMTEILKAGKLKGMVTANKNAAILGEEPTYSRSVIINGKKYDVGSTGVSDMLGYVVDFYYKSDDEGERELVFVKLNDEKSVLEIEATRIRSYDETTMTYTFESGETTRLKKEKIARDSDIIYNGKNIRGDFYNFKPENGYIRLIDNDNDGTNEVVIIMDYVAVTVGATDITDGSITDIYDATNVYKIALYDDDINYVITDNRGVYGKFQDIDKYNTVFIAQSQDKELTTIITSDEYLIGSISSFNEDEIVINGVTYESTAAFRAHTNATTRSYGKFYFDPLGRIAYYESLGELGIKSGMITKAYYDEDADAVLLNIFTDNGKFEKLYTAEKLFMTQGNTETWNSETKTYTPPTRSKVTDAETEVLSAINTYADAKLNGMTFVLYQLNGKGEIKELEFAAAYADDLALEQKRDLNNVFRKELTATTQYKSGWFGYSFRQNSDTTTYVLPADKTNREGFHVYEGLINAVRGWGESSETISYKKNSNSAYSDYIIEFGAGGSGTVAEYPILIVQDVFTSLNADDEVVKSVKGYWNNAQTTLELSEELSGTDLEPGDVMRCCVTDEGVITNIESRVDYSKQQFTLNGNFGNIYGYYFGKVYDMIGTKIMVSRTTEMANISSKSELGNAWGDGFKYVYKFDTDTKELTTVGYASAKSYLTHGGSASTVYMHFHYGDPQEMIIYE